MKRPPSAFRFLPILPLLCCLGHAQSLPATTGAVPNIGFQLPKLGGSFQYALSASELISTGFYNTGTAYTTNLSGDLAYISRSTTHPFSAIYSGGVLLANSNQPNTTYQTLNLSQIFTTKNWNVQLQDAVSYLPESPVTGLSGIPGVGDLGIDPVPVGPGSGIGILTNYGPRVSNSTSGSASRILTGHLSAQGSGYYSIERFVGDNSDEAVDNSTEGGSGGLTYHFGIRSALTGNYNYSKFNFVGTPYAFTTQGGTIEYSRQWTRRFVTDFYVGPQHIASSDAAVGKPSTELAAGAEASFFGRTTAYTVDYTRGVNNGSGVIPGSFSDNVVAGAHRQFHRDWNVAGSVAYSRNVSLPAIDVLSFSSQSVEASGQVARRFGRRLSGYASYTVERQSVTESTTLLNAFSGVYQIVGFGITYAPEARSLGK